MTRFALVLAIGWLGAGPALADPPRIDRTIGKEPAYRTRAPQYGLLLFGPEGKDRVWLVLDGDTLYVDRNGNGDLTEPGEKVAADRKSARDPEKDGYSFDVGEVAVGSQTHKGLRVYFNRLARYGDGALGQRADVKAALARDPQALIVSVGIDAEVPGLKGGGLGGRVAFWAGPVDLNGLFQFADTPAEAPAVHLGGPLEITFYVERPTLRVGRAGEFSLVVGTPGAGPGTFAMVNYQDTIPESVRPVADITYPPARADGPPVRDRVEITDRC